MFEETRALLKNKTWEVVKLPYGKNLWHKAKVSGEGYIQDPWY